MQWNVASYINPEVIKVKRYFTENLPWGSCTRLVRVFRIAITFDSRRMRNQYKKTQKMPHSRVGESHLQLSFSS